MKKHSMTLVAIFVSMSFLGACVKSNEEKEEGTCYPCRAINASGTISKELCSDTDKAAFRTQYTGYEIDCQ